MAILAICDTEVILFLYCSIDDQKDDFRIGRGEKLSLIISYRHTLSDPEQFGLGVAAKRSGRASVHGGRTILTAALFWTSDLRRRSV